MGVYYLFLNDESRERVEPFCIGDGGIKWGNIIYGDAAHVFTFLIMRDPRWRIQGDHRDEYYDSRATHRDITEATLAAFNEGSGHPPGERLLYVPRDR